MYLQYTVYLDHLSFLNHTEISVRHTPQPCWKRSLYFICGLAEDPIEEQKTTQEQKDHLREVISLEQDPRAKKFLTVNCIFVLLVCVFFLVYFTIPDGGPTGPTVSLPYEPFIVNGTRPYE